MDPQPKPLLEMRELTGIAIGAFFDVYNELAGFPEFVVCRALAITLRDAGLNALEDVRLPVWFRGRRIVTFKADLVVNSRLIIEVKARPTIEPFNKAQLLHYLKATKLEVGLLMNFGRKPEFSRVIYQHARNRPPFTAPADLSERLTDIVPPDDDTR
jgi:GxxExxY protein